MPPLTSRQNPVVARFRDAARGGNAASLLLDGAHLVATAIESGVQLEIVAALGSALDDSGSEIARLVTRVEATGARTVAVNASVLAAISPVRAPSGIVALAARPAVTPERLLGPAPALIAVVVGVQDPGNVGAIVRTADAAGASGVIVTAGSADPFGWKALRGSMGSALRVPIWGDVALDELRDFMKAHEVCAVGAMSDASTEYDRVDLRRPVALIVGSEGRGLPDDVLGWVRERVRIPMREGVESLNVAVTAALLLYEARRQRGTAFHGRARSPNAPDEGASARRHYRAGVTR